MSSIHWFAKRQSSISGKQTRKEGHVAKLALQVLLVNFISVLWEQELPCI